MLAKFLTVRKHIQRRGGMKGAQREDSDKGRQVTKTAKSHVVLGSRMKGFKKSAEQTSNPNA